MISIANNNSNHNKRDYLSICDAWIYLLQCDSLYIYLFLFSTFRTHKCVHCQRIQHKTYVKWKQRLPLHFRHDSIEIHQFDELSEAQGIFVACLSSMRE